MKCLKVDEYIKRTASVEDTELLRQELKVSLLTNPFKSHNFWVSGYISLVIIHIVGLHGHACLNLSI